MTPVRYRDRLWVGVDPGKKGAFVAIDYEGDVIFKEQMPVDGKRYNIRKLSGIMQAWMDMRPFNCVCIERQQPFLGGQSRNGKIVHAGSVSIFEMGRGMGMLETVFTMCNVSIYWVMPRTWQKRLALDKKVKGRALKRAIVTKSRERWPKLVPSRIEAEHPFADAAWIADYARVTHNEIPNQLRHVTLE